MASIHRYRTLVGISATIAAAQLVVIGIYPASWFESSVILSTTGFSSEPQRYDTAQKSTASSRFIVSKLHNAVPCVESIRSKRMVRGVRIGVYRYRVIVFAGATSLRIPEANLCCWVWMSSCAVIPTRRATNLGMVMEDDDMAVSSGSMRKSLQKMTVAYNPDKRGGGSEITQRKGLAKIVLRR